MNLSVFKPFCLLLLILSLFTTSTAQLNSKQKGLLWEISGNGLRKPSYVYGTMHISRKLAFHLGDSFYYALTKSDIIALEQNLDSVIHKWISEDENIKPEDIDKVDKRSTNEYLNLTNFTLHNYDKDLVKRKLSAEVREVNYLLKRGNEDDFEEDAWLDLYIYQLGKRLGKDIAGVEGYEESRALVEKSRKEPEGKKDTKRKLRYYDNKMRDQVSEAYRKGNIFMIDSIDRLTESDHYREYMLYKRNENMVRRMDSIVRLGKVLFTGVGCAHLPGKRGVLQLLIDKGYKVRPVQSLANEKSKLADKYENMTYKHKYAMVKSDDDLISASLPSKLTKVRNNSSYSSYLSPDLANGYYYQIEKITCNTAFSGKSQEDILLEIDTMIFENIPGEMKEKKMIMSNGFPGIEIVTELKTGDLNRFQILTSPFNVYIVRMAGKKKFAVSSDADKFFKTLKINESNASGWQMVPSGDSVFSLQLPVADKQSKLPLSNRVDPTFEHLVYDKPSGNTYLIKQVDFLNDDYIEEDTFELSVMAKSFSFTNDYVMKGRMLFDWQGYHALDVEYEGKHAETLYARFVLCGTRYIMFLKKPGTNSSPLSDFKGAFGDKFFTSIRFNGKPTYSYFKYNDTNLFFSVTTPCKPLIMRKPDNSYYFENDGEEDKPSKYDGKYTEMYFKNDNANEFIKVGGYRFGYYERQSVKNEDYLKEWEKTTSMRILGKKKVSRNNADYYIYDYTDTNSNKRMKIMTVQYGAMRYFISGFMDSISGKNDFVNTFFNTFSVSDTLIAGNIFEKKGYLFFNDFTSKDSLSREMSLKHFKDVAFYKQDIANLKNAIDTISSKSKAFRLKTAMISRLGFIDSADAEIVPYLHKLYAKVGDTTYLQLEILQALAHQRSDMGYKAIKPILSTDIPISDNKYEMESLLYDFNDSLKLTKLILPELLELTTINEYRNTAYAIISQMKDSGIIVPADYASIHNRIVTEARIEYKRAMSSITNADEEQGYNSYSYGNTESESVFSSILNLSLPLRSTNKLMQMLVDKILEITDNSTRISILPVLLKNGVDFKDSVYDRLAKTEATTIRFYKILSDAKKLNKFPEKYRSQKQFITADIRNSGGQYSVIDSIVYLDLKTVVLGKKSYHMYVYKYHLEESDNWMFYTSDPMPTDTTRLFDDKENLPFYSQTVMISEDNTQEKVVSDILFDAYMRFVRERNGGYYESNYGSRGDGASYIGDYEY